ncbi:MAG: mechanosensitive ion channel domain-containing protein, partial [Parvularculaceae bacterium]
VLKRFTNAMATISVPIALWLTVSAFILGLRSAGFETVFLEAMRSLILAWIAIRLVSLVIRSPFWSKLAFYTVWPIAALEIFGLLDNVTAQLDLMSVTVQPAEDGVAAVKLSLLDVIRALIIFVVFFFTANALSKFLTRQLGHVSELNPSLKTLVGKILDLVLPIIALIVALQLVGFNLASLAIFSGAIGLGIGLGLQRLISNFAGGVTLLADKSVKPGDTIVVGDSYGWVTRMNTRYIAIRTRDGTEHLIPNDSLINNGVINWSYGDNNVRVVVEYGVSYAIKDQEMVRLLGEQAAATVPRVLKSPPPRCNLHEFGDSSVNYILKFWINDPPNGLGNVKSDVLMAVWQALAEQDIEIPFPQRDVHIKTTTASGPLPLAPKTLD